MRDPYKSDPWLKRGRAKWHDTQRDKDGNTAAMRRTRKRARTTLKKEVYFGE
jgi:hypothetical protein